MSFDISKLGYKTRIQHKTTLRKLGDTTTATAGDTENPIVVTTRRVIAFDPLLDFEDAKSLIDNVDNLEWKSWPPKTPYAMMTKTGGKRFLVPLDIWKKLKTDKVKVEPVSDAEDMPHRHIIQAKAKTFGIKANQTTRELMRLIKIAESNA